MLLSRIVRFALPGVLFAALASLTNHAAEAKPPFAQKEGVKCVYCHVVPGGPRNFRGDYYEAHKLSFADFDNEFESKAAGVAPDAMGADAKATVEGYPNSVKVPAALNFTLKDIDGKKTKLARWQGDVVLVVNVASKCGLTPQYEGLQKLYAKYKAKGFVLLGIPANEFGMQEPGTDKEIKEFCTGKYNVTFPMFSKIVVKGEEIHPLYKYLTSPKLNKKLKGYEDKEEDKLDIEWNFAKFLVDRKGKVIARFAPKTEPNSPEFVAAIEKALKEEKPTKEAGSEK